MSEFGFDLSELDSLSPAEREYALKILREMQSGGKSETYNDLRYSDYEEIPVDIDTFLHDKRYLGNGLIDADGRFTVFPYWVETLKKIFPNNIDTAYNTLVLTGGIGLGKSFMAVLCMSYLLHRMLCLKDPYLYYGLQPIDKITFSFINVTIQAAKGVAWDKIQQLFQTSPWFMSHGTVSGITDIVWKPSKRIELVMGSSNNVVIGRALFCNFTDEINFSAMTTDTDKIKAKQKHLISQIDARMQSRFMKGNKLPTLNILASSKNSDQSFLETYIDMKKEHESKTTLVIDEPQWVIRNDKDSPQKFYVAIGSKFLASEVLPLDATEELANEYRDKGYQLLRVPSGYYEAFKDNVDLALTDIAGISTVNALKYISGEKLKQIKTPSYRNPFTKDIIEVGTNDTFQYSDFFDMSVISSEDKYRPMYIHLDMSISGDKTGIAGVWIAGKRGSEVYYKVAFSVSIKAPKGYEISFEKNRNFIRWLKEMGFAIKGISCDTFQSAQIQQQLTADGFDVKVVSVDRLETASGTKHKVCLPYAYFQSSIYEKRLSLYDKCDLLTDEILGLERESDGHINHPNGGTQGCFTGDTKVSLVDGRELSFLELVDEFNSGKTNFVYSFNETTKRIEAKKILNAWCTNPSSELVEVTLDNGEKLRCTPNHRFMLRDGSYCEAKDLLENDSLMPLYRKFLAEQQSPMYEYRLYYEPIEDKWHFEHRRFVSECLDGIHQIVHHKNCIKTDNSPTNLVYCSKALHAKIHSDMQTGCMSPSSLKKKSESVKQCHESTRGTQIYEARSKKLHDAWLSQHGMTEQEYVSLCENRKNRRKKWEDALVNASILREEKKQRIANIENMFGVVWDELSASERDSYSVKYTRIMNPEITTRISCAVSENHRLGKYARAEQALSSCNEESHRLKELIPNIDPNKFEEIFGIKYDELSSGQKGAYAVKYRRILAKQMLNHKVVSVRFLSYKEPVYDITVEDNHNFALTVGVFVHNSKDQCDAVVGALWNASQNVDKYAYDYGETLDIIEKVNSSQDDAIRKQISVSMEEELAKIVDPIRKITPPVTTPKQQAEENKFRDYMNAYNGFVVF